MPAVANDAASFDPVDFYTKQLPLQLAQLTELRDELRKRQGALSAAEDALRDRDEAAKFLTEAKSNAPQLMDVAKVAQAKVNDKKREQDARSAALDKREADLNAAAVSRETSLSARERDLGVKEAAVVAAQAAAEAAKAALEADRAKVADKLQALQNMAASLKG